MRKIKIEIRTENAAFVPDAEYEVARILERLVEDLRCGAQPDFLRDLNGNTVGTVKYTK